MSAIFGVCPHCIMSLLQKNTALRYHRLCALALRLLGRLHDDYVIAIFSVCRLFISSLMSGIRELNESFLHVGTTKHMLYVYLEGWY